MGGLGEHVHRDRTSPAQHIIGRYGCLPASPLADVQLVHHVQRKVQARTSWIGDRGEADVQGSVILREDDLSLTVGARQAVAVL